MVRARTWRRGRGSPPGSLGGAMHTWCGEALWVQAKVRANVR
ncbi:hypothetical protein GQ55_1G367500 [Panicum hallii var. hallii]|uniref:Uncharacterized protein n=1 Tax=Panicum hallii var. hallii TaxID=1504633 RepID=A0A2T7FBE4_9POAL|nr:hypothetical protein GQ55_1G367500 [Panicum hallii var. hallii]